MNPWRDDSPEPVQRKPKKLKKTADFVDIYGEGASAAVELHHEAGPITLDDARQLVLWILGEETNPRWCFVKVTEIEYRMMICLLITCPCMCEGHVQQPIGKLHRVCRTNRW